MMHAFLHIISNHTLHSPSLLCPVHSPPLAALDPALFALAFLPSHREHLPVGETHCPPSSFSSFLVCFCHLSIPSHVR